MKAAVIGAGSWGSAFARHLGRMDIPTRLWVREEEVLEQILQTRENRSFLPGFRFPKIVQPHHELKFTIEDADLIFIAVPSKYCRSVYEKMSSFLTPKHVLVSLTKGLEEKKLLRMSETMIDVLSPAVKPRIAVLSGPSFAKEVAQDHPTAVVVASYTKSLARKIQLAVSSFHFRCYTSQDVIGVELGGALKNVIAISAGISDGLKYGNNSLAALMTRGIAEIARLGKKMGAKSETFSGLAGFGDLILTCTGKLSRNRFVGYQLGKGNKLDKILAGMNMVAEGISTTHSAKELSLREKVELPISEQVFKVLYYKKSPQQALQDLLSRRLKGEHDEERKEK